MKKLHLLSMGLIFGAAVVGSIGSSYAQIMVVPPQQPLQAERPVADDDFLQPRRPVSLAKKCADERLNDRDMCNRILDNRIAHCKEDFEAAAPRARCVAQKRADHQVCLRLADLNRQRCINGLPKLDKFPEPEKPKKKLKKRSRRR